MLRAYRVMEPLWCVEARCMYNMRIELKDELWSSEVASQWVSSLITHNHFPTSGGFKREFANKNSRNDSLQFTYDSHFKNEKSIGLLSGWFSLVHCGNSLGSFEREINADCRNFTLLFCQFQPISALLIKIIRIISGGLMIRKWIDARSKPTSEIFFFVMYYCNIIVV